jgi:phosphoribosylanthranilate isomerase
MRILEFRNWRINRFAIPEFAIPRCFTLIVQIYEIQTPEEAEACIALGVDHLGSVLLTEETWRHPPIRDLIGRSQGTGTKNSIIPLFHQEETIFRALDYYRPHFLHLCEALTDPDGRKIDLTQPISSQTRIKERFPEVGIMRSIPIPPDGASLGFPLLSLASSLEPVTDLFLIDTWLGLEPVEGYIGITGKTVDWDRARDLVLRCGVPVILAGGLSPENVCEAILKVGPHGVDSCTRTNQTDPQGKPVRFKKDFKKVERFVQEARRAGKTMQVISDQ